MWPKSKKNITSANLPKMVFLWHKRWKNSQLLLLALKISHLTVMLDPVPRQTWNFSLVYVAEISAFQICIRFYLRQTNFFSNKSHNPSFLIICLIFLIHCCTVFIHRWLWLCRLLGGICKMSKMLIMRLVDILIEAIQSLVMGTFGVNYVWNN